MLGRGLAIALLLTVGAAEAQEKQVQVPREVRKNFAEIIQRQGFDCADIRAVYFIGEHERGTTSRLVCANANGEPIATPMFRLVMTPKGLVQITRWTE